MNILAYVFIAVFVALGAVICRRIIERRCDSEFSLTCLLFVIVAAIVGDIAWGGFFA